jgi:DNA polymerase
MVGDFSGIESRITALLAGEQTKLDAWRAFDNSGDPKLEPYYRNGIAFGLPEDKARDVGKTADLACGFQGSVGAWRRMAPNDRASDAEIERRISVWRRMHPRTVKLWDNLDKAVVSVTARPKGKYHEPLCVGLLAVCRDETFLYITSPSGRKLAYPFPRVGLGRYGQRAMVYKRAKDKNWFDHSTYGGELTENVVSATARDLLAFAMARLEAARYPVVLHLHDEIVCEVPDGFGSLDEFKQIITQVPGWAAGLPLAAKVREGPRFCKTAPWSTPTIVELAGINPIDVNARVSIQTGIDELIGEHHKVP